MIYEIYSMVRVRLMRLTNMTGFAEEVNVNNESDEEI